MTLTEWEEKRDRLSRILADAYWGDKGHYDCLSPKHQINYQNEATAALEFLGMKKPVEEQKSVWCEHVITDPEGNNTVTGGPYVNKPHIKYCDRCGTPRPGTESKPCHPPLHELANVYGLTKCEKCGNHYEPESKPIELPEKLQKCWRTPDDVPKYAIASRIDSLIDAVDQLSRRIK